MICRSWNRYGESRRKPPDRIPSVDTHYGYPQRISKEDTLRKEKVEFVLRLSERMARQLDREVKVQKTNRTALVRQVLLDYLRRQEASHEFDKHNSNRHQ